VRATWTARLLGPLATLLVVSVVSVLGGESARAEEPRHRVSFSVEREQAVENDRATATLAITAENSDAAALAAGINQTMEWALGVARRSEAVSVHSGGYRTWPIQEKGRLHHWRATQELVLASSDIGALSELVGKLQGRLPVASLRFSVSPERRRTAEDELIRQALQAARARAELVRKGLGAQGFDWIELHIQTGRDRSPPLPVRTMAVAREGFPAPALQAGASEVRVTLSASIELE